MATITLASATRTYTNTAASDDYVMRFGSLSDITAFTGSYVINATTPTAGNLFPQDGADKYVIELVNVIDPVTGQPTGSPSAWYQDYRDVDGTKGAKTIIGFKKILGNEKFMADNAEDPTWKSVALYMKVRDSISTSLRGRPSNNIDAKENVDLRMVLDYYVNQLKAGDLEFANIYDRFLSQDRIYDKYLGSGL